MRSKMAATRIAVIGGVLGFLLIAWLLRFHAWLPLLAGTAIALALLGAFWPKPRRRTRPLPDDVAPEIYEEVIARLSAGADCLRTYAEAAPPADAPLFQRMAELLDRIRAHHVANPGHAPTTRRFIRHALGRMLSQIADYVDLTKRAGGAEDTRLAEISRRFEAFVPALERIDKACVDNDLAELEINVDVLNEQLDRRG